MTLLLTVFAALISTLIWYKKPDGPKMKLGFLSLMFWGASLMWFVDAIFEYMEDPALVFEPKIADMLNDAYLGICVIALGVLIWLVSLLISDPLGRFKKTAEK